MGEASLPLSLRPRGFSTARLMNGGGVGGGGTGLPEPPHVGF